MKELEYTANYCGCDVYTADELTRSDGVFSGSVLAYCKDLALGDDHYKYRIINGKMNKFTCTQHLADTGQSLADWVAEFKIEIEGDL